jgi:Flp pilus assembly protein TadD
LDLAALYRECGREAEAEDLYRRAARIAAPDARPVSGFSGGQ